MTRDELRTDIENGELVWDKASYKLIMKYKDCKDKMEMALSNLLNYENQKDS